MQKKTFSFFFFLALFFFSPHLPAENPGWCPLCSMNLSMYQTTNNRLTLSTGETFQTCSIFCAAQIYEKTSLEVRRWEVMDFSGKQFIDAREAFWVIGSDLPGVMTAVSKVAFSSQEEARRFQKGHTGLLGTFKEALDRTLADMGSDKKMIMDRVAKRSLRGKELVQNQGCLGCHYDGGQARSFTNPELISKMDSRIRIKEAIVKGSSAMKGYAGKVDEKDLHSITLYLWSLKENR
jgi:nitrous oxide reductase accessory protein NosL